MDYLLYSWIVDDAMVQLCVFIAVLFDVNELDQK